ncbi:MAG: hypothetical protein RLZZ152_1147, partial [Pseudomonadota bacterium]
DPHTEAAEKAINHYSEKVRGSFNDKPFDSFQSRIKIFLNR